MTAEKKIAQMGRKRAVLSKIALQIPMTAH
jgi:hypothetical protein